MLQVYTSSTSHNNRGLLCSALRGTWAESQLGQEPQAEVMVYTKTSRLWYGNPVEAHVYTAQLHGALEHGMPGQPTLTQVRKRCRQMGLDLNAHAPTRRLQLSGIASGPMWALAIALIWGVLQEPVNNRAGYLHEGDGRTVQVYLATSPGWFLVWYLPEKSGLWPIAKIPDIEIMNNLYLGALNPYRIDLDMSHHQCYG